MHHTHIADHYYPDGQAPLGEFLIPLGWGPIMHVNKFLDNCDATGAGTIL